MTKATCRRAAEYFLASQEVCREIGCHSVGVLNLVGLAHVACGEGDALRGKMYLREAVRSLIDARAGPSFLLPSLRWRISSACRASGRRSFVPSPSWLRCFVIPLRGRTIGTGPCICSWNCRRACRTKSSLAPWSRQSPSSRPSATCLPWRSLQPPPPSPRQGASGGERSGRCTCDPAIHVANITGAFRPAQRLSGTATTGSARHPAVCPFGTKQNGQLIFGQLAVYSGTGIRTPNF